MFNIKGEQMEVIVDLRKNYDEVSRQIDTVIARNVFYNYLAQNTEGNLQRYAEYKVSETELQIEEKLQEEHGLEIMLDKLEKMCKEE